MRYFCNSVLFLFFLCRNRNDSKRGHSLIRSNGKANILCSVQICRVLGVRRWRENVVRDGEREKGKGGGG